MENFIFCEVHVLLCYRGFQNAIKLSSDCIKIIEITIQIKFTDPIELWISKKEYRLFY